MPDVRLRTYASLCFLLLAGFLTSASGRTDFAGEWKSGVAGNPFLGKQAQCTAVAFTERGLRLTPTKDNPHRLTGEWKRETTYYWLLNNGGSCRWGDETSFTPSFGGTSATLSRLPTKATERALTFQGLFLIAVVTHALLGIYRTLASRFALR
jgi:hypothetical protein